jgi:hypothetical protein
MTKRTIVGKESKNNKKKKRREKMRWKEKTYWSFVPAFFLSFYGLCSIRTIVVFTETRVENFSISFSVDRFFSFLTNTDDDNMIKQMV